MSYAVHLAGNLPVVQRNAELLYKGLGSMVTTFQAKVRQDTSYLKASSFQLQGALKENFLAHSTSWVAVNQFMTFLGDQGQRMEKQAQTLHSDVLVPLKRFQTNLNDRYRRLLKQSKGLEQDKEQRVQQMLQKKQKYMRVARESEELRVNMERVGGITGKWTQPNGSYPVKLSQRLHTLEKEVRQAEVAYRDAAEALQFHMMTAYDRQLTNLLNNFEQNDIAILQTLRESLCIAANEFLRTYEDIKQDLDRLFIALAQWDPLSDVTNFAEHYAQTKHDLAQTYAFEPYPWEEKEMLLSPPRCLSPLQRQLCRPTGNAIELRSSKSVDLRLVDTIRNAVSELLRAVVEPPGVTMLLRQCTSLQRFILEHGELKGLCLKFRLPDELLKDPDIWNDGVLLVVKTCDWEAWDSTVTVTEEGLLDQGGQMVNALADLYPVGQAPPDQPTIPAEIQTTFLEFLKTLNFIRSPPNSPSGNQNQQNVQKEDELADTTTSRSGRKERFAEMTDSASAAYQDASKSPRTEIVPTTDALPPQTFGDTLSDSTPSDGLNESSSSTNSTLSFLSTEDLPPVPAHVAQLLHSKVGRLALGRALTTQRVEAVSLDEASFRQLMAAMLMAFDFCLEQEDTKAATILLNMCHTFYHTTAQSENCYLQIAVKDHRLFKSERFWWDSFMDALITERQKQKVTYSTWKDLSSQARDDIDRRMQNIAFGQLSSFVFNMNCMGVQQESITQFVEHFCEINSLAPDLREQLMLHASTCA